MCFPDCPLYRVLPVCYYSQNDYEANVLLQLERENPVTVTHLESLLVCEQVIQHGFRPAFSSACPRSYRQLAMRCWHQDWKQRPTFTQIRRELIAIAAEVRISIPRPEFQSASLRRR